MLLNQYLKELHSDKNEFKKVAKSTGPDLKNHSNSSEVTSVINLISEKINSLAPNSALPDDVNPLLMKLLAHTIE